MMNRRFTTAAALLPVLLSLPAVASERAIEEVIVTAQKREQNLQDVSISVTAFGEGALKKLGVTSLDQLAQYVSATELFDDRGAGQPTWVIRGVGLADFNANNTPTAAIYYDEYYLTSNALGGIGLFDVARVEVLKGPQGGLYGRNTSGGAVRVMSRKAEIGEEFNGYIKGSYGRWDRYGLEAAMGGELSDRAAFRISAVTDQGGGWQDSLATPGDDHYGDRDFLATRTQLRLQPNDTLDIWLKLDAGEDNSETTLGYSRALFDPATGNYCASALAGKHDERNCVGWSNLTNVFALTPGDPGILHGGQDEDGTKVLSSPINKLDNNWIGANLQISWDLGPATLTSISGYLDYEDSQVYDFDAQPLILLEEDGTAQLTSWSQELRLASNGEESFDWLVGAMYAGDEVDDDRVNNLRDNVLIYPGRFGRGYVQETESWAIFGQADIPLNDTWLLTSSVRYTDESKEYKDGYSRDDEYDFFYFSGVNESFDLDNHWSGHVGLEWRPTDDAMLYGRITQGFKSGGFFGGFANMVSDLEAYGEERVLSYEIGFKTSWLDNILQLNGAAYFYDYQDVQGFTQALSPETGTVVTKLGNLGDAEHTGVELDAIWLPVEGLSLNLQAAWLDAKITDSDTVALSLEGTPFPIEGSRREFAPEWSTSMQARYEWRITELLAAVQLNYSWRDDLASQDKSPSRVDHAAFSHEGYGIFNARLSIGADDQSWNLALVGNNITDEVYWARASGDSLNSYVSTPALPANWMIEGTCQW